MLLFLLNSLDAAMIPLVEDSPPHLTWVRGVSPPSMTMLRRHRQLLALCTPPSLKFPILTCPIRCRPHVLSVLSVHMRLRPTPRAVEQPSANNGPNRCTFVRAVPLFTPRGLLRTTTGRSVSTMLTGWCELKLLCLEKTTSVLPSCLPLPTDAPNVRTPTITIRTLEDRVNLLSWPRPDELQTKERSPPLQFLPLLWLDTQKQLFATLNDPVMFLWTVTDGIMMTNPD